MEIQHIVMEIILKQVISGQKNQQRLGLPLFQAVSIMERLGIKLKHLIMEHITHMELILKVRILTTVAMHIIVNIKK